MTIHKSFCRLCSGLCGVLVEIDASGRLQSVRGDREHAMTWGYACSKGLAAPEAHNHPDRLLHPLKRMPAGHFVQISLEQALDEISVAVGNIMKRDGADAIAAYRGTANYLNSLALPAVPLWLRAIGSSSMFSTMTIDQSAKWVCVERLGRWHAGRHPFEGAEVSLVFGANPLVSIQGGLGITTLNPSKRLAMARAQGLRLIVVDPRQTELAKHADIHLQIYPGEDVSLAAGLLHLILREGWQDVAFCARWADGLDDLQVALARYAPAYVAARCGIPEEQLWAAASMFAHDAKRGAASSGTGPNMGPHSNLAEHLIELLNVVCGRYLRAGEPVQNPRAMSAASPLFAEVCPPKRRFELPPFSRVRNLGRLMGEKMTGALADEILQPGPGQVKALFVVGGNPASALPNQARAVEALQALELLVAVEPRMSTTAQLAHYILPPKLQYERPDVPILGEPTYYPAPFAQYTPALATPPSTELVDEWYVFWALGQRLQRPLRWRGQALDGALPPSSDALLDMLLNDSRIPMHEIRQHPGGRVFDIAAECIQPARNNAGGRFAVMPMDVAQELGQVRATAPSHGNYLVGAARFTHLLAVRRLRAVLNTTMHELDSVRKHLPFNTVAAHPDDLRDLNFESGEHVAIIGARGRITAILESDAAQKRGVLSMSHGWGSLPGDGKPYTDVGACTSLLVSDAVDLEAINAMPQMTALPVRLERLGSACTARPSTAPD